MLAAFDLRRYHKEKLNREARQEREEKLYFCGLRALRGKVFCFFVQFCVLLWPKHENDALPLLGVHGGSISVGGLA